MFLYTSIAVTPPVAMDRLFICFSFVMYIVHILQVLEGPILAWCAHRLLINWPVYPLQAFHLLPWALPFNIRRAGVLLLPKETLRHLSSIFDMEVFQVRPDIPRAWNTRDRRA